MAPSRSGGRRTARRVRLAERAWGDPPYLSIGSRRSALLLHDNLGTFDACEPTAAALVGSYNLSQGAEQQDSSLVVFDDEPDRVTRVEAAWRRMFTRETGKHYTPTTAAAHPSVTDPGERDHARPTSGRSPAAVAPTPTQTGQVWVNLNTGAYHLPGTRYYGKAANGDR